MAVNDTKENKEYRSVSIHEVILTCLGRQPSPLPLR